MACLPAQTIKHENRLCYTAGCFRKEKRRADQYSYLTAVHCFPSSRRSELALDTFQLCPAIPPAATRQNSVVVAPLTIGHKFCASFPLPSKGTQGSCLQNLRHLDEQLIFSSAQLFFLLLLFCSSRHRALIVQRSDPLWQEPVVQVSFHCSQPPLLIALLRDIAWKFRVGHTPPLLFFIFFSPHACFPTTLPRAVHNMNGQF